MTWPSQLVAGMLLAMLLHPGHAVLPGSVVSGVGLSDSVLPREAALVVSSVYDHRARRTDTTDVGKRGGGKLTGGRSAVRGGGRSSVGERVAHRRAQAA